MKIVCLSDTHGLHNDIDVPAGDVIVFGGDICNRGTLFEVRHFALWLSKLPHTHKIIVSGNHCFPFEKPHEHYDAVDLIECLGGSIYLEDEEVIIDGVKFYGSPWQPEFYNWAFNLPRGEALKKVWSLIPDDTNVLITHSPPFGILDEVGRIPNKECTGCVDLKNRIMELKELKLHVFGHIHSGYGQTSYCGKEFVNASICNEAYEPIRKPIVVEI